LNFARDEKRGESTPSECRGDDEPGGPKKMAGKCACKSHSSAVAFGAEFRSLKLLRKYFGTHTLRLKFGNAPACNSWAYRKWPLFASLSCKSTTYSQTDGSRKLELEHCTRKALEEM
jgi:hypothetical protein